MSKAKTNAGQSSSKTAGETGFKAGTDAFKAGFEKAAASQADVLEIARDNVQAYVQAAAIASQNAEILNNQLHAFTKQSFDESVNAAQAVFGARSVQQAFEAQGEFIRTAFESWTAELTRFNTLATDAAKESLAPLQDRFQAVVAKAQAAAPV